MRDGLAIRHAMRDGLAVRDAMRDRLAVRHVMRDRLLPALGLCAIALLGPGCPDTDDAVFVEAYITAPSATVSGGVLGTNLAGSFEISLHLGPRASGESMVTAEAFAITNAGQTVSIVDPLQAQPGDAKVTFPVTVEPDSDVTVAFVFDTGDRPILAEKLEELCGAGGLRITAVLRDSLADTSTPVASQVFEPAGCP